MPLRITFSTALRRSSNDPRTRHFSRCNARTSRSRGLASKAASSTTCCTRSSRTTVSGGTRSAPLSRRVSARSCPTSLFTRSDSCSIRSRARAARPLLCLRASSRATVNLASGDRTSCEISASRRFCDEIRPAGRSHVPGEAGSSNSGKNRELTRRLFLGMLLQIPDYVGHVSVGLLLSNGIPVFVQQKNLGAGFLHRAMGKSLQCIQAFVFVNANGGIGKERQSFAHRTALGTLPKVF